MRWDANKHVRMGLERENSAVQNNDFLLHSFLEPKAIYRIKTIKLVSPVKKTAPLVDFSPVLLVEWQKR